MGNVSPATPLANLTPRAFRFSIREAVNFKPVFYSDAAGSVPLLASAGGTMDLLFESQYAGSDETGPVPTPIAAWDPNGSSIAHPGATLRTFGLGAGAGNVTLTPSNIVAPGGGALSYRLHVVVPELS